MKKTCKANLPAMIFLFALLILWQAGAMGLDAAYILPSPTQILAKLWELRDVAIIGVAFLLSVLALAQTGSMIPLVGTVLYAFLSIQVEGSSVLDFLRRAACFLFLQQQYYEWGQEL